MAAPSASVASSALAWRSTSASSRRIVVRCCSSRCRMGSAAEDTSELRRLAAPRRAGHGRDGLELGDARS